MWGCSAMCIPDSRSCPWRLTVLMWAGHSCLPVPVCDLLSPYSCSYLLWGISSSLFRLSFLFSEICKCDHSSEYSHTFKLFLFLSKHCNSLTSHVLWIMILTVNTFIGDLAILILYSHGYTSVPDEEKHVQ